MTIETQAKKYFMKYQNNSSACQCLLGWRGKRHVSSLAIAKDLPAIVELAQLATLESRYAWMPFRAKQVWTTTQARLTHRNYCSLVAYNAQGELVGFLQGQRERFDFASTWVAHLRYWYVTPPLRGSLVAMKMFTGFQQWAKQQQVVEISAAAAYGNPTLDAATGKL
jgi:Acetyltransferase (GNAT) family